MSGARATLLLIGKGRAVREKELPDLDCAIKGTVNYFEALEECFKGISLRPLMKYLKFSARFRRFAKEVGAGLYHVSTRWKDIRCDDINLALMCINKLGEM